MTLCNVTRLLIVCTVLFVLIGSLGACGLKGPLYLPDEQKPLQKQPVKTSTPIQQPETH